MDQTRSSNWLIGVAAVVALVGLTLLLRGGTGALFQSATGFEGLRHLLVEEGHPARSFEGGYPIDGTDIGLRIVPFYDLDLQNGRRDPVTRAEALDLEDERDFAWINAGRKAETIRTLFVLPKWRRGMRLSAMAHPEFENSVSRAESLLRLLVGEDAWIDARRAGFTSFASGFGRAEIYQARTFRAETCVPIVGTKDAIVLGECTGRLGRFEPVGGSFYVLVDPDLLNSHGLRLGENAEVAPALLSEMAEGKTILIDYSNGFWTRTGEDEPEAPPRTWSDFLALFGPGFRVLWAGLIIASVLALWRGGVRFGPPRRPFADGPGAARSVSTEAQARLLRLSGDNPALLRAYADARIHALSEHVFGLRATPSEAALWALLERRAPEAARHLRECAAQLRGGGGPTGHAMDRVAEFDDAIGQVIHGLK